MKKKVIISIFAFIIISLSLVSILIIKNRRNTMTVNSNIIEDKPDSKVESSDEQNVDEKTILNDTKIEKKEDVSKNESINKSSTNNVEVSSKNSNNGSNNAIDNNQNNKQSNSTINSSVVENNKEETGPEYPIFPSLVSGRQGRLALPAGLLAPGCGKNHDRSHPVQRCIPGSASQFPSSGCHYGDLPGRNPQAGF